VFCLGDRVDAGIVSIVVVLIVVALIGNIALIG
jgi:hypothetical protein